MDAPFTVLATLAWLTSGLAAAVVAPRNRAAQALVLVGAGLTGSVLLTPVLPSAPVTASGTLLVQLGNVAFFLAVLAATAVLVLHPHGTIDRRWYGVALLALAAAAVATIAVLTFAAPRVSVDGSGPEGATHPNPLAIPWLAGLEPVAEALWTSALAWPLVGVVVLADRLRRTDPAERRRLVPLASGMAVLAALLVVQLVAILAGVTLPQPGFAVVFQIAFAILPIVLLAGIAGRTRALEQVVAASRSRIAAAEDRARREIERDLHDGAQQQLVAMLSVVELAKRQSARGESPAGTLADLGEQVSGAITDLRELVSGIRPPVLQDAGVAAALLSRIERLPADVVLDSGESAARWDDAVEAAAYFVGCEAVTNAVKHAPGAPVRVRVVCSETELEVEVRDAGPGIPASWRTGRGLSGLQDRVASLGGVFAAVPSADGGTTVSARFTR